MSDPTDTTTYFDRAEFLEAQRAPEYATSARYRQEVQDKLARSYDAGNFGVMGEVRTHNAIVHDRPVIHSHEDQALYGNGVGRPLGANPNWAEAVGVGQGFFDSPEAVARAMAAPHYEADPSYQSVVAAKIARSIREGHLTADLKAGRPAPGNAR